MSIIPTGRADLFVEMEAEVDGVTVPNGVRWREVPLSDPDLISEVNMEWTCDDDTDDDPLEIVVDIRSLAELISKAAKYDAAQAHLDGCPYTDIEFWSPFTDEDHGIDASGCCASCDGHSCDE